MTEAKVEAVQTRILGPGEADIAGEILKGGGLVAIPTETVYGLAANAFDPGAVGEIFAAKGRPADNPLIVHIQDALELSSLCADIPPEAWLLAERLWPGPFTMVLRRKSAVPSIVSAGLDTVAVRLPSHPVARAVIRAAGTPLAAPSANRSGSPSPTSAAHVLKDLGGRIDAVLDGGDCEVGLESTVISLAGGAPVILRPGAVTPETLSALIPGIGLDRAVFHPVRGAEKVVSPGMKYRHYAPSAPLRAVRGGGEASARYIAEQARPGDGVICFDGYKDRFSGLAVFPYGGEGDMKALAKNLYGALRRADESGAKRLFIQCPEDGGVGIAVQNRILRAAAFDLIRL